MCTRLSWHQRQARYIAQHDTLQMVISNYSGLILDVSGQAGMVGERRGERPGALA